MTNEIRVNGWKNLEKASDTLGAANDVSTIYLTPIMPIRWTK